MIEHLRGLSAGQAAGIIAAGIFATRIIFRLLWPFILVGLLRTTDTAVTWSVVSRELQSSYWPSLLRTDSAAVRGVRSSVTWSSRCATLAGVLLSIAAIVTPLGLYEAILPGNKLQPAVFDYARDPSVFGAATPPRPKLGFSRLCGYDVPVSCPNSGNDIPTVRNSTGAFLQLPDNYTSALRPSTIAFFQSGAKDLPQSVSSFFDIQYRKFSTYNETMFPVDGGNKYLVGSYSQFASVIMDDKYEAVEGLVIDTKSGGIGFRNHTIPVEAQAGASWKEDLLFIQPETACVNTNLSLEFTIPQKSYGNDVSNYYLVDHGGFVNLNTTVPEYTLDSLQDDPLLQYRAYGGAWGNNIYTAIFMNITNPGPSQSGKKAFSYMTSELGRQHPMPTFNVSGVGSLEYKALNIGGFGSYLNWNNYINGSLVPTNGTSYRSTNPWKITQTNMTDVAKFCSGATSTSYANASSVFGSCGLVRGVPQPRSAPSDILYEPGTDWTVPLYSCASSVKAMIKTVTFTFNGTSFEGLVVSDIQEKKYQSPKEYPLWAVENTEMRLLEGPPLWGLVAKNTDRSTPNITFKQAPRLWLSAWQTASSVLTGVPVSTLQNIPGADFFSKAFAMAYDVSSTASIRVSPDYSGVGNLPMYNRWRNLSGSVDSTANILNLIWTDLAANAVVGTKSWLSPVTTSGVQKRAATSKVTVPVLLFTRRLRYKFQYAVPAIIVLVLVLLAVATSAALAAMRRATLARLQRFLNQTSVGRMMTASVTEDANVSNMSTREWVRGLGQTLVDVGGTTPRTHKSPMPEGEWEIKAGSDIHDPMLAKGGGQIRMNQFERSFS